MVPNFSVSVCIEEQWKFNPNWKNHCIWTWGILATAARLQNALRIVIFVFSSGALGFGFGPPSRALPRHPTGALAAPGPQPAHGKHRFTNSGLRFTPKRG